MRRNSKNLNDMDSLPSQNLSRICLNAGGSHKLKETLGAFLVTSPNLIPKPKKGIHKISLFCVMAKTSEIIFPQILFY